MKYITVTIGYKGTEQMQRIGLDDDLCGGKITAAMLGDGISQIEKMEVEIDELKAELKRTQADLDELDAETLV